MTGDLKPCLCGRPARIVDEYGDGEILWAECTGLTHECGHRVQCYDTKDEVVEAWNKAMTIAHPARSDAVARLVEIARTFLDNYRSRRRADKEAGRAVQGAFIYDDLAEALAAVEKEIGT